VAIFDEVYRQHLPTVLRAAARAVGRRDVAEEITADAFLELYRQFDRIDVSRLPGWLLTVVRNRAIDYWRRQQTERVLGPAAATPASVDWLFWLVWVAAWVGCCATCFPGWWPPGWAKHSPGGRWS
jgi:DNA-directed RNA polymerase specialized sigma24 family protein